MVSEIRRYRKRPLTVTAAKILKRIEIETLEGVMVGNPGDYLIRGVKGELYPCKPDIFEETYELVSDEMDEVEKEFAEFEATGVVKQRVRDWD